VYGYEYRERDNADRIGEIPRLMRFYLFVACMVTTHILFNMIKASPGLQGFFSITHVGLCQSIPGCMCCVYCGIFLSHSAMLKKKYNVYGFIEENAPANASALPSPPRDNRSFLSIAMSYWKMNLYLFVLGLALMGIDIMLTKHIGPQHIFTSFMCPILYFLGFFFYAFRVFHYRTSLLMLLLCLQIWVIVHYVLLFCHSALLLGFIYTRMIRMAGGVAAVTSEVPSVTGASTASVETGTGSNLKTQGNRGPGGTDSTANQLDERPIDITAPGIINTSDYSHLK
jgi:hypothetical protein